MIREVDLWFSVYDINFFNGRGVQGNFLKTLGSYFHLRLISFCCAGGVNCSSHLFHNFFYED